MTDYKNWMTAREAEMGPFTLRDFAIPGSHDAGSKGAKVLAIFGNEAAEAQSLTVKAQLEAGSRYLDLRAKWLPDIIQENFITQVLTPTTPKVWVMKHGPAWTMTNMFDVLKEIREFNAAHPKEIILITLAIEGNNPDAAYLEAQKAIGPALMDESTADLAGRSISNIMASKKVIYMQKWPDSDNLLRTGIYSDAAYTPIQIYQLLKEKYNTMPSDKLWVWHIAPPYRFLGPSLQRMVQFDFDYFAPKLKSGELLPYDLNIVNCDYVGAHDWAGACIEHNDHKLQGLRPTAPGHISLG